MADEKPKRLGIVMRLAVGVLGAASVVGAGCSSTVVVAGSGAGGTGATGATGTPGTTTGAFCQAPAPVGSMRLCEAAGGGTTGSGFNCLNLVCDQSGNSYAVNCTGQSCECMFNNTVVCTCKTTQACDANQFNALSCCPAPFPKENL